MNREQRTGNRERAMVGRICSLLTIHCSLLLLPFLVQSQPSTTSSNSVAQKAFIEAGQAITYKVYPEAIKQLQKAVKSDPGFLAAWQQLGDVYRVTKDYKNAIPAYRKVLEINPEYFRGTYLGLGESEFLTEDYSQALIHLRKYASYPSLPESSKKQVAKYITDCLFSAEAIKNPVPFKPENMGTAINSRYDEYLPVLTADEETLIFTRQVNSNEDFYKSTRQNGLWTSASYFTAAINTPNFNEGAQCISADGRYFFFTGCNRPGGAGSCDIYLSKLEANNWSNPFNLGPPINTPAWESQPSISVDGSTIYFASNRAGGFGGYDIWKSELQTGGKWSAPVNLGATVNTPYDEQSPFIHPDNETLYFSSNGWPGFGSRDLFISRKDISGNWKKTQNLGYPINSSSDEGALSVSSNGKTAFFTAIREGGAGGLDIYSFSLPETLRPNLVTYVKGSVFDKSTKEFLGAEIKITNLQNGTLVYDDTSNPLNGSFLAVMSAGKTYSLIIEKPGYLFYSANFSLTNPTSVNKPFYLEALLEKIEAGKMVVLNNIFFDTNKFDLLPESTTELKKLLDFLNNNPSVSIEISGHTDSTGDPKINQVLSENRAKAVYDFLVENKISASRLLFKGYGLTKPIADNNTEEGRKSNRRTEFVVIKK